MASRKREQLIRTAARLFHEEGFHATGIDRITSEAGVVRMTLYNHFASKEALVAAVLAERHERFLERLDRAVREAAPGGKTLALVDEHGAWVTECGERGCILVQAMGEYGEHSPTICEQARRAKTDLYERLAGALAADGYGEAPALTRHIFLVLEGGNAAVPVFGVQAAVRDARAAVASVLASSSPHPAPTVAA